MTTSQPRAATEDDGIWRQPENEPFAEELFLAGERVPPGIYRQIDSKRVIYITSEDHLPASLDGRVACHVRVRTWARYRWKERAVDSVGESSRFTL